MQCELFSYSSCDGNSNRFSTLKQCINTCGKYNMSLVIITIYGYVGCSLGTTSSNCRINLCSTSKCPEFPNAICEVNKFTTTNCSTRYFVSFKELTTFIVSNIKL